MKRNPVSHQRVGAAPSSTIRDPKHFAFDLVVRHKKVLDLSDEIWADVADVLERSVRQRLRRHGDQAIILLELPLVPLLSLDRTDQTTGNNAANECRRI